MKLRLFVLLLLCFYDIFAFAQEYELREYNPKKENSYVYSFKPKTDSLPNVYNVLFVSDSKSENNFEASFLDYHYNAVLFVYVYIISNTGDTAYAGAADTEGRIFCALQPGNYSLKTSCFGLNDIDYKFSIQSGITFYLDVKWGSNGKSLTRYVINSKRELSEADFIQISNCINKAEDDFIQCETDDYEILLEL